MHDNQSKVWHLDINGQPAGPFSVAEIRQGLKDQRYHDQMLAYTSSMTRWEPIMMIPGLRLTPPASKIKRQLPDPTWHPDRLAHDIDFVISGDDAQCIEIELDPDEAVVAEAGSMLFMESGIEMETIFGDGRDSKGIVDNLLGAGKRLLTGESLFMTVFTNQLRQGKRKVAFSAPYTGKIIPMNLAELGNELICQKDAFLCAAKGVEISIAFQKRIGVGLFGGEGFIMEKLRGDGLAFVHAGGMLINRKLARGETLKIDSGCIVALEPSVDFDIQYVGGIKSALFGGEGFFLARVTGPGNIWLQSMPFSRLAGRIYQAAPQTGGVVKGEGSVLGQISGIGNLFERNF